MAITFSTGIFFFFPFSYSRDSIALSVVLTVASKSTMPAWNLLQTVPKMRNRIEDMWKIYKHGELLSIESHFPEKKKIIVSPNAPGKMWHKII